MVGTNSATSGMGVWARFIAVLALIALGIWLAGYVSGNETAQAVVVRYGYLGVFALSIASGFNVVVPVPAVAFMPVYLAAGLDFRVLIVVMSCGMLLADMAAFAAGRAGRGLARTGDRRMLRRLEAIRERNGWLPLAVQFVYAAAVPFPNEVISVPLGLMGYRAVHVAVPLFLGNIVFNTVAALGIAGIAAAV